jgi:hypothetical protein
MMNYEFENHETKRSVSYIKVLTEQSSGKTERNNRKLSKFEH